uniref:Uncharacterized protein n=1 Tax=Amphimedon queenslandica TaxID=400682 RepID=A0A1X7TQQ4_AMPQE
PPNCFQNVFTETEINTNSLSVTNVIPVTDTRAFPDIQFTCNGIITKWIIGITQSQDTSKHYPNIYLKRSSELIYALTVDASAATSSNGNVYNFTSDIEVEYGDILVINGTTNSNPMYYQQYNGPLNYELDSSNGLIPLEHNDYPLISVAVEPTPSVTKTSSSTVTEDINTVATMTILSSSPATTDMIMTPNSTLTSTEVIHYSTSLHYTTTLSLLSTTSLFLTNGLSSSDTTSVINALSISVTTSTNGLSTSVTTSTNILSSIATTSAANVLSRSVIDTAASLTISSTSVPSSSSSIVTITPSPTLSITESITTPLSSIESSHPLLSTGSISSTEVTDTQNTVSRGNPTSEVLVTSKKSSNSISEPSVTRSSEPTVLGNTGNDNTITIIAAIVATVLVLMIISIIVILILIGVAYKRRSKATLTFRGHDTCLVNATYSDIAPNGKEHKGLKDMCNPNYESQGPIVYEEAMPVMNGIETVYGDTMIDSTLIHVINPTYGAPKNCRKNT